MSIWDDPELAAPPEPQFVRLDKPGDGFEGIVESVTKQNFDDGTVAPQITFRDPDGEQRSWTAGQLDSKRKLAELRPVKGDYISVQFTGTTGKFKHIDIRVTPANARTQTQLPVYQPAPPPVYATNGAASFDNGPTAAAEAARPASALQSMFSANTAAKPADPPPCPPGVDPEMWGRMAPEQREMIRSAVGATPAF